MKIELTLSEERKLVEKEVRDKLKKYTRKSTVGHEVFITDIIDGGIYSSTLIKRIEDQIRYTAHKLGIPTSDVYIRNDSNYYNPCLIFFKINTESDKSFEKRIQNSINKRMLSIKMKKKRKAAEAKRKRKIAIEAIKELGDDIYEIFRELNRNSK